MWTMVLYSLREFLVITHFFLMLQAISLSELLVCRVCMSNFIRHATFISNFVVLSKAVYEDFPGGPVVKNLPANAGDMGSTPALGRSHILKVNYAHVPQLPSQHTLGPMFCNKRSHHNEKPTLSNPAQPNKILKKEVYENSHFPMSLQHLILSLFLLLPT